MRCVEKTYEGWIKPNLFDINPDWEIDVVAHTWFNKNDIGQQYALSAGRGWGCPPIPQNVLETLYQLYNPKKVLIEHQIDFKERFNPTGVWNPEWRMSKMYSIKQSCALKKLAEMDNGVKYDAVIMLRYDMDIRPIDLNSYDLNSYNTSTHATSEHQRDYVDVSHGIMSSDVFERFAALYDASVSIVTAGNELPSDEKIAFGVCQHLHIPVARHEHLSGYTLVRS